MKRAKMRPAPCEAYDELIELLGQVAGPRPWMRADLYVDRTSGMREVIVYTDGQGLPCDLIGFESGMRHWGDRDGSDGEAVIGAARVLAAVADGIVRTATWRSGMQVFHLPLAREAYEPLVGVGILNPDERLRVMRELMGA
ncbi:hypothetical protein AB0A05_26900 [Streptomyces sp. NPDC046374]|uniref:hypothetical protein n=1 Tax=Streptomyces sp. NPDC046374 TaxID=3154917 RepID=UPI0034055853